MGDSIQATILDTVTGETALDDRPSTWFWSDGSGSCDCNRELRFPEVPGVRVHNDTGICLGSQRYLIVAIDPTGYPLKKLNKDYPPKLLEKYLPN